jgi:hypothetical protein
MNIIPILKLISQIDDVIALKNNLIVGNPVALS